MPDSDKVDAVHIALHVAGYCWGMRFSVAKYFYPPSGLTAIGYVVHHRTGHDYTETVYEAKCAKCAWETIGTFNNEEDAMGAVEWHVAKGIGLVAPTL